MMHGTTLTDETVPDTVEVHEPLFDVRRILAATWRNRWLIAAIMLGCLMLAGLYILLVPRTYQATAKVEIGSEAPSLIGESTRPAQNAQDVERTLQTQVDLLNTREMAMAALRLLASDPKTAVIARTYRPDDLMDYLETYLPKSSRVVSISFQDHDPGVAAAVANAYSSALIQNGIMSHFNSTTYSRDYLGKQMQLAKGRLEQSERALVSYARLAGLLDASEGGTANGGVGGKSLTTSDLVQINSAYSLAKANRIQAQQRWAQAQRTSLMNLPEVLADSSIQDLNQQRAQLMAKLQEDRMRYGDSYPQVRQGMANIGALDRQIATIAGNIRNSLRSQYNVAASQEAALAGTVGQLKGSTLNEQDRSVEYNVLKRETDTNRQIYDALLQRYKEVSAEAGLAANNIRVAERAHIPRKVHSPKVYKVLAAAIVAGLLLSLLAVVLRQRLDRRVNDPEALAVVTRLPLLGFVPMLKEGVVPGDAILDADSSIAEAAHSIRAAIDLGNPRSPPASILLTSSTADEGKSTTALALAHALADAGERVLVIDGDIRRPSLHGLFGIDNGSGLCDILARRSALQEAVRQSAAYNVDVLVSGSCPESPAALLKPEAIRALLAEASQVYSRVVIDGPPALGIADASLLGAAASATVFLVRGQGPSRDEVQVALRRLRAERINVIGAILTMYEPQPMSSGYGYAYRDHGSRLIARPA